MNFITPSKRALLCLCAFAVFSAFAASEMRKTSEGIVVDVDAGETATWATLFAASGLTAADCAGVPLIKTGEGSFDPAGDAVNTVGIGGVEIREGRYYASSNAELGLTFSNVTVKAGATLVFDGGSGLVKSRTIKLAGTGSSAEYPAVRIENGTGDTFYEVIKWNLQDDAAFFTVGTAITKPFAYTTIYANGHTLSLNGDVGARYKFQTGCTWDGTGGLRIGPGVRLITAEQVGDYWTYKVSNGGYPLLTLGAGASFEPSDEYAYNMFRRFAFGNGAKLSPSAVTACSIDELTGTPIVSEKVTSMSIARSFHLSQTDILAGNAMTAVNEVVFGDACKFFIDGFSGGLIMAASGATFTLATAGTITGCPVLSGVAADYFTLTGTGTTLTLTRKPYDCTIEMMGSGWGVRTGEENAAANASAVAARLPSVADGTLVLVEPGDYWFDGGLDLGALTARGVTFMSMGVDDPAVFHSSVLVGASQDVTLDSLVISGTTGPAVVANGTQGLTIKRCRLVDVTGSWTDGHVYPYAFTAVGDLLVSGCSATFATSPAWTDQAWLSGGTQRFGSEVRAGYFVVGVEAAETKTWAQAIAAFAPSAYTGRRLVKVGPGEFYPMNEGSAMQAAGIGGVEIQEGWYSARAKNEFGVDGSNVVVKAGATLILKGSSENLRSRTVYVEGSGSSPEYPAVRTEASADDKVDGVTWNLTGDATFYNAKTGTGTSDGVLFKYSTMKMNGHTLTLTGVAGSSYRFYKGSRWYNGGTVIVGPGVQLRTAPDTELGDYWKYHVESGTGPEVLFRDAAVFKPESADIFKLFKKLVFEGASSFSPSAAINVVLDELTGAPTLSANVTSLTVNRSYTARRAEIAAGTYLDCPGTFAFGEGAVVNLDDATGLFDRILVHAEGGVSGQPRTSDAIREATLKVVTKDEKTFALETSGLFLIFR